MSAFSAACAVPFDNFPNPVSPLEVQPLPVPLSSTAGRAFLSWREYQEKTRVDTFVVKCWTTSRPGEVNSFAVVNADTFLVTDLDITQEFACTVEAIDAFGQRSVNNDTVMFTFDPRWVFTPNDLSFDPFCFKDTLMVLWDWVGQDLVPRPDTTFGADSVQLQISIDPSFRINEATTEWLSIKRKHTFTRPDYPFVGRQNDTLYARIRGKDKFQHISPWSTEFFGNKASLFDDVPPPVVACQIDSITAPDVGDTNTVEVSLSWEPAIDNCSGTHKYLIVSNLADTVMVSADTTAHTVKGVSSTRLQDTRWKVLAQDSLRNMQTFGSECGFEFVIRPPDASALVSDDTICWNEGQTTVPNASVQYVVELSSDPGFLRGDTLLSETSPPLDSLCYQFGARTPWNPDTLYWRVKCEVIDFESPWSTIFTTVSGSQELVITDLGSNGSEELPSEFRLYQNYPNPFNPATTIGYDVAATSAGLTQVRIEIFNVLGQRIRTLVDAEKPPGHHSAVWDGTDDFGVVSASGIYYYKMRADVSVTIRRMLFLK